LSPALVMDITEAIFALRYHIQNGVRTVNDDYSNQLASHLWGALEGIRSERIYSVGKPLFRSGQRARGIYMVEEGEVRLVFDSDSGGGRLFEKAGPGVILGLSEAMSGDNHKLTAESEGQTQVSFIERNALLAFLRSNPALCMQVVRMLSEDLHVLYHRFVVEGGSATRSRKLRAEATSPPHRV